MRGAYTGATQNRVGRFEQAHGGTLFLDEIGDLPLDLQAKLLRVLQEREFQRLGSSETLHVDIRVIAATNRDLLQRVGAGAFREDLYYRLNVVPLEMPPLRHRLEDVPSLAAFFAAKVCKSEEIPPKLISREALDRLAGYSWPGNVRQLENAVEMAIALSGNRGLLTPSDFPSPPGERPEPHARLRAVDFRSRRRPRLRADPGNHRAQHSRTGPSTRPGATRRPRPDMLRLKRTTLSAKMRSLDNGCLQLRGTRHRPTRGSLWRLRACRSRPARAPRESSSAKPARVGRSECT